MDYETVMEVVAAILDDEKSAAQIVEKAKW